MPNDSIRVGRTKASDSREDLANLLAVEPPVHAYAIRTRTRGETIDEESLAAVADDVERETDAVAKCALRVVEDGEEVARPLADLEPRHGDEPELIGDALVRRDSTMPTRRCRWEALDVDAVQDVRRLARDEPSSPRTTRSEASTTQCAKVVQRRREVVVHAVEGERRGIPRPGRESAPP